jgi:predicted HTH transcriptional regulator
VDDTPVHEAIREALVNTIIHADFTGRASLYVVKRPDMFGFRNPGLMRVPLILALRGGNSDCRNRNLQKMFQLVGLGEQAGSGLPKVYRNWKKQHWRLPELVEQLNPDQTVLRLRMVSLLPEETLAELDQRFGARFRELPETARLALAAAAIEGHVTHTRLREMCSDHPNSLSAVE